MLPQGLSDSDFVVVDPLRVSRHQNRMPVPCLQPVANRVRTGHQRRPRRRTNRLGVEAGELHPFRRHTVEIRSAIEGRAERADVPVAHVVDEDQDDVWLGGFSLLRGAAAGSEQKTEDDSDGGRRSLRHGGSPGVQPWTAYQGGSGASTLPRLLQLSALVSQ